MAKSFLVPKNCDFKGVYAKTAGGEISAQSWKGEKHDRI